MSEVRIRFLEVGVSGFRRLFPGETMETCALSRGGRVSLRGVAGLTQEFGAAIEASDIAAPFLQIVVRGSSGVAEESPVAGGSVARSLIRVESGIIEKETFGFVGFVGENVVGEKAGDLVSQASRQLLRGCVTCDHAIERVGSDLNRTPPEPVEIGLRDDEILRAFIGRAGLDIVPKLTDLAEGQLGISLCRSRGSREIRKPSFVLGCVSPAVRTGQISAPGWVRQIIRVITRIELRGEHEASEIGNALGLSVGGAHAGGGWKKNAENQCSSRQTAQEIETRETPIRVVMKPANVSRG